MENPGSFCKAEHRPHKTITRPPEIKHRGLCPTSGAASGSLSPHLRPQGGSSWGNTPAWPFPKPKTHHFPLAFLDVLILEGFVQAEAGKKNDNHQVSKEPQVSHPLPKTRVLHYETWKNVKDRRETPGNHILGVWLIYLALGIAEAQYWLLRADL